MFRIVPPGFGIFLRRPVADGDSRSVRISGVIHTAISRLPGGQPFHIASCDPVTGIVLSCALRTENYGNDPFGKNGHGAD